MTNIAPMNIISSITGNLSEEDVKNFQFCDREFMAYRRQAANALTMMVYYFGKIQEILSDDDFEIYWSKYLGISKRTKYKWLAAYLRAKQKLSDGEGNIDLQFFSRFSLTGIAMLEDANDEVIEEIKARNPGKEAITQKEIETVIKKFQDQLSESKAIAEKAIAEKEDAQRIAKREREDSDKLQEKLTNERNANKVKMTELQQKLAMAQKQCEAATISRDRLSQELAKEKEKEIKPEVITVEVDKIPEGYKSVQDAIKAEKGRLREVTDVVAHKEREAQELDDTIASLEGEIAAIKADIERLTEEKNSFESLFTAIDSLIANWPHTLLQQIDTSNTALVTRMRTYADTLDSLTCQLRV